jgi:putative nucleotidyltransferase with HDIG domain
MTDPSTTQKPAPLQLGVKMNATTRLRLPRPVLLPGWWFELIVSAVAVGAIVLIASREQAPALTPLVLFLVVLLAAENSTLMWLPSEVGVDTSFMVIMAGIAAFGTHGAVLGAAILGIAAGLTLSTIQKGRYTVLLYNCSQYLFASAAAALVYRAVGEPQALAFVSAVSVFAVVNCAFVVPVTVLDFKTSARSVWSDMRPVLPNYVAFGLLGVLVGSLYRSLGPVTIPLLVIPAIVARKAFASFMELREAHEATVKVFISTIEAKDQYTAGHTERVAKYALYIGEQLKMSSVDLEHLRFSALLHDVGKLAVPRRILNKPGKLTEEEYAIVQRHNQVCVDILTRVDFMSSMVGTASDRHAHYDRSGARDRDRLVREAHIVAVADAFDAMTSTRSYRRALSQEVAFAELRDKAGSQFNPACVEGLVAAITRRGERYGLGHEEACVEFDVPPPVAGVGSAGLGDLLNPEAVK